MVKNRLRIVLAQKDIKVSELQKMTGISKNTLYDLYHNAFRTINTDHMDKICKALKVTPAELFEYTEE